MDAATSRDWDAATYHRVSDPQFAWALEQLERLPLAGDEVVLDAGCGSGRVTAELVARVPRGRVYGVDAAPSMAEHAQAALGDRAMILCQDLVELSCPSRSTRSSPTPPSTGSAITRRCSGRCGGR